MSVKKSAKRPRRIHHNLQMVRKLERENDVLRERVAAILAAHAILLDQVAKA